jgi:hypothetical protein
MKRSSASFSSASVDISGGATVAFNGVTTFGGGTLSGGTLSGSGAVTVTGALGWTGGAMSGAGTTTIANGASLNLTGSGSRLADRPLVINGIATLAPGGNLVLVARSVAVAPGSSMNMADNVVIVDYTGRIDELPNIKALLTSGYNGGAWNGAGINSSLAASIPQHALGYARSSDLFSTFPATFAGQQVDSTAILIRYTRYGDANLDQFVNLADFNRLASAFGQTGTLWSQANFNYDNITNLTDFNRLASNFGLSSSALSRKQPSTIDALANEGAL